LLIGMGLFVALPSLLAAQENGRDNQVEFGVYADYFRFAPGGGTSTNFVGAGGRVGFAYHHMGLEAEMNYDFARNITTTVTNSAGSSTTTTFVKTGVRPLTGLFGPVFHFGPGNFHAFVTGKVGFINFTTTNPDNVTGQQAADAVASVGGSGTHFAAYPGGGVEGFWGPVGLRLEAGDEVYLNNDVYNNLRVTVGPQFRF
ncbi:MAG TPA: hypothetical protein VHE33_03790, partial [Acidobacteriaceae bacterium]|nr:hypothetical protein [Acidobacteriaceae bacterium]